jgi:hypothetical protein
LIVILESNRAILKRLGIYLELSIYGGRVYLQKGKQEGPFWKKGYKGWGFLIKMGEGEGLKGKIAPFFLLPTLGVVKGPPI